MISTRRTAMSIGKFLNPFDSFSFFNVSLLDVVRLGAGILVLVAPSTQLDEFSYRIVDQKDSIFRKSKNGNLRGILDSFSLIMAILFFFSFDDEVLDSGLDQRANGIETLGRSSSKFSRTPPLPAMDGIEVLHKRMKTIEGSEGDGGEPREEEVGMGTGSPEMETNIQHILEKIERLTVRVSELLEAGKTLFKDLTTEFEDRLIAIHREHIEKWQEEIKELRMMDASNEAARARLQNAQLHILQSVRED
ncbi:hypothetical protein J5N97_008762 [Dioscorea zingiberensis]|uniref:Uncharacterized protein n=1 Tax=Dioscorea zingiberensis TaxID=325984 RepID=A0A9D5HLP3_9LILI|nr:hypothetical protein J5N97_008762 [Dioscorea zingiberensis]